jgi:hypothetical protein
MGKKLNEWQALGCYLRSSFEIDISGRAASWKYPELQAFARYLRKCSI